MSCESNQESTTQANLKINGETVELNDFVESFMSQTVIGMVKSLRGVDDIKTISLEITNKA